MSEVAIAALSVAVLVLAVCVPLIPAVVIYSLFPDTKVGLSGPLEGLTVRATGAFAAYIVVFVLTVPTVGWIRATLNSFVHPSWTITARVLLVDKNGKTLEPQPGVLEDAQIGLRPKLHEVFSDGIRMKIPGRKDQWPRLTLQIPGWGSEEVDLSSVEEEPGERYEFELQAPILVREYAGQGVPYEW
jgi:hypothetical protein